MSVKRNVRPAEKEDPPAVVRLINGIQRDEFGIPITLQDQPVFADIDGYYRKGAGDFVTEAKPWARR